MRPWACSLRGPQRGAAGHQRHRAVLVAAGHHLLQRQAGRGGDLGIGDVGHQLPRPSTPTSITSARAACLLDAIAQEGDLVALGVDRADEQNRRLGRHRAASTAANDASSDVDQEVHLFARDHQRRRQDHVRPADAHHRAALVGFACHAAGHVAAAGIGVRLALSLTISTPAHQAEAAHVADEAETIDEGRMRACRCAPTRAALPGTSCSSSTSSVASAAAAATGCAL
jgi:hypothetical protein